MRDKLQGPPTTRPRLSPKSLNETRGGGGYFVPPTPAAVERPPPSWNASASNDNSFAFTDENGPGRGGSASRPPLSHDAGGEAGGNMMGASRTAGPAGASPSTTTAQGWGASAPPSFALSPSSTAFNAKFTHLLRGLSSSGVPGTPLDSPASSPFFAPPGQAGSSAAATNPFDLVAPPGTVSSSASPHSVPPTPGPSTTGGLSSGTASSFAFPMTLPPGRRVAGRPSSLASRSSTASVPVVNSSRYTLYNPQTLFSVILSSAPLDQPPDPPPLLLLDIRPHTAYLSERITGAINICVPSTLLRRPAFGIDRVAEGLPAADQAVFEKWASASSIVVLDNESTSLVEGGGVASLLAKFDKAGFKGKLGWVKGGWYALKTHLRGLPTDQQQVILDSGSTPGAASAPATGTSTPFEGALPRGPQTAGLPGSSSSSLLAGGAGSKKHGRPVLQVRDLPIAAFQLASTSAYMHESGRGVGGGGGASSGLPTSRRGVDGKATSPLMSEEEGSVSSLASQRPDMGKRRKSGNEPGTSTEHGSPSTSTTRPTSDAPATFGTGRADGKRRFPHPVLTGGKRDQLRTSANPFFDNIRQNSEVRRSPFLARTRTFRD